MWSFLSRAYRKWAGKLNVTIVDIIERVEALGGTTSTRDSRPQRANSEPRRQQPKRSNTPQARYQESSRGNREPSRQRSRTVNRNWNQQGRQGDNRQDNQQNRSGDNRQDYRHHGSDYGNYYNKKPCRRTKANDQLPLQQGLSVSTSLTTRDHNLCTMHARLLIIRRRAPFPLMHLRSTWHDWNPLLRKFLLSYFWLHLGILYNCWNFTLHCCGRCRDVVLGTKENR